MKVTVNDLELKDKKVLLRADFNVPLDEYGNITSDKRIVETLPTIRHIIEHGGSVIICSHLGRPKGIDPKLSLKPVAKKLEELLQVPVIMSADVADKDATAKAKLLKPGEILLLENLRFEKGEEENNPLFAKKLAALANIYVNDAFGTAHRAHASTEGVAKLLPNAIGFLMSKEVETISSALTNPDRPFVAILGGAKINDKIKVVNSLLSRADYLLLGGGMAFTFIKALGGNIGNSICDDTKLDYCREVLKKAEEKGVHIILPLDFGCAHQAGKSEKRKNMDSFNIAADYKGLDIGRKTVRVFSKVIKRAKTVIWNGTLGTAEFENFAYGTNKIAKALTKVRGTTIIGGGDTAAAVIDTGYASCITHISTGGGAALELIEGAKLPGVEVIRNKP